MYRYTKEGRAATAATEEAAQRLTKAEDGAGEDGDGDEGEDDDEDEDNDDDDVTEVGVLVSVATPVEQPPFPRRCCFSDIHDFMTLAQPSRSSDTPFALSRSSDTIAFADGGASCP